MEELLQNALEPEETVLWTGKCGSFETLDCVLPLGSQSLRIRIRGGIAEMRPEQPD